MINEVKRLLIVTYSQTGGTRAMAEACIAGASDDQIEGVEVVSLDALDATAEEVQAADGIVLGTPENFGYMSGALKYFFDRIYYPCLDHTRGTPYALFVKSSTDGLGAVASVQKIVKGLAWREAQPPLVVTGDLLDEHLEAARELGMTMAAGIEMGLF